MAAQANPPRIGVISGDKGSFAAIILKAHETPFENVTAKLSTDSLSKYGLLVVDNLFKLQDLAGPAFRAYVEKGGGCSSYPKVDGFPGLVPYEISPRVTLEAKIEDRRPPVQRLTDDRSRTSTRT